MNIPTEFRRRIELLTGDERYFDKLGEAPFKGLRVNTLKAPRDLILKTFGDLKPVPFCDDGFYINEEISGNHPLHHAGAFYLQEPSAMSAVTALGVRHGDRVLDLCAAPGGKSTQIAAALGGEGLLVSNEYVSSRVPALVSNIERMGIPNCVITNGDVAAITDKFINFFDCVLVDAPCSGEGMIRKFPSILGEWSMQNIEACAKRQLSILLSASGAVKPGGKLCYSTCTYAPEENEGVIAEFLRQRPDFELIPIEKPFGRAAFPQFAPNTAGIEFARRIFIADGGEGHFVALMRKKSDMGDYRDSHRGIISDISSPTEQVKIFKDFYSECFLSEINCQRYSLINAGDRVFIKPHTPLLDGVPVVRAGVFAGQVQKGRFVPSHALFTAVGHRPERTVELMLDNPDTEKFLHGEEIACAEALKGYVSVTVDGVPTGFGKASGGRLKNHYPKGLRTL